MCSELPAAPQPLQVLHVSEQEEDVFAFGMGLKQSVIETETVYICEHDITYMYSGVQWSLTGQSHSCHSAVCECTAYRNCQHYEQRSD